MRNCLIPAAVTVAIAAAAPARAGDYVSIIQETTATAPAGAAWARLKGFCAPAAWLKTTCSIAQGQDGELGAMRRMGGRSEVIVARTPMSYTYADTDPAVLYHGTVEVRPVDAATSKLVWTLFYDESSIPAEARTAERASRAAPIAQALAAMKVAAERD
jgi:hypothetical protein